MDRLRRPAACLALAACLSGLGRPPLRAGADFESGAAVGRGFGLGLPETPAPLRFDPTSIKSLGFADPSECVPPPEVSEPGPFGEASFRLPLRLPPGRAGMTPALALRYSSDAPGGPAGRGFDIELSAVTTETRFGAPRYDESDVYLLDGRELVRTGRDGSSEQYRPRVESDFRLIRRNAAGNDWEITEKSGLVREYGFGEGWIGPSDEERGRIYAWYLTRERDAFGNTVEYVYDRRGGYAYPAELRYTGNEALGDQGAYRVVFTWEARKDRRQDCRGGFFSTLGERLVRVDILFRDSVVRSYRFEYGESIFGQSLLERFVETDAAGGEFYAYAFEYNELEKRLCPDGVPGYEAFEETEPWSGGGVQALQSTRTGSGGTSLYVGVQVRAPILGIVLASFGVRGGCGSSATAGEQVFVDVNGDGLGDAVSRSGDGLAARLNTGGGFSESPVYLGGLGEGSLDREGQTSAFLGASAGLLGATGALTKQYTWTEARTAFSDVDGDGYPDFLTAGSGSYRRGDGMSFSPAPWTAPALPETGESRPDSSEEEEYRRTYYVQAPLRKWKAWRSGEVEIRQGARLVDAGSSSADGLVLRTFAGSGEAACLALSPGAPEASAEPLVRTVAEGEGLYFLLDSLDDERGDEVDWGVRVIYRKAAVFEDLAERGCLYRPPDRIPGAVFPYGDALKALYAYDEAAVCWRLSSGWRAAAGGEALAALAMAGFAVPRSIPREDFLRLLDFCDAENRAGTITVESGQPDSGGVSFDATERDLLRAGYDCIPETGRMRRNGTAALYSDGLVSRYLPRLGEEAVRSLLACPWPLNASPVCPVEEAEGVFVHRVRAPERLRPARMDSEPGEGEARPDSPLVLDAVDSGRPGRETVLLSFDSDGSPEILIAGASETTRDPDARPTVAAAPDGSELSVSFRYRGVERLVRFSEGTGLLEALPADLYEWSVLPQALARAGERCSAENVESLDAGVRDAIAAGPDGPARLRVFDACYEEAGTGRYVLRPGVSEGEYAAALLLLDPLSGADGSLLDSLPGDPPGFRRIVLLSGEEAAALSAAGGADLDAALGEVTDEDGAPRRYVSPDASVEAREALEAAMTRLRCDVEGVFPHYEPAGYLRVLKPEADAADVEAVMAAAGLRVWTRAEHSLVYRSSDLLEVETGLLPEGAETLAWAPAGGPDSEPDGEAGLVRIPSFDASGRSVLAVRGVPDFDSDRDYSARDLVGTEADPELAAAVTETFRGGVRGWYYGAWSGYYEFDEGLLSRTPPARDGEATPPPYFSAMEPNAGADGSLRVAEIGGSREPVPADAWTGPVSEYSETGLDSSLNAVGETWTYAALVRGNRLSPARNGGAAYHSLPREAGGGADSLAFLCKSRSAALDVNGGVGLAGVGASLGRSSGVSWQYRGLLDMNGDRYPDLVAFPGDRNGDPGFRVNFGTGSGFAECRDFVTPFGYLRLHSNASWEFGASAGSAAGALRSAYSADGRPDSVSPADPEGVGAGLSGGVHGSFGRSFALRGLCDLNGDGLPDHVARDGGSYAAAVNLGGAVLSPARDWGGGISRELFSGGAAARTDGLETLSLGSYGGSLGGSYTIAGTGPYLSTGFSAVVHGTHAGLRDVNGDGLPDEVAKDGAEAFFRVRSNLGDRFAEGEVRLLRPEWSVDPSAYLSSGLEADLATVYSALAASVPGAVPAAPGRLPDASGNKFAAYSDPLRIDDVLDCRSGVQYSFSAGVTISVPLLLLTLTMVPGVNLSMGKASATLEFIDLDGDGLPDHVLKLPGLDTFFVRRNLCGAVGLLKTLRLPQGGAYRFEYASVGCTQDLPLRRWVLSALTRSAGGLPADRGPSEYRQTFEYEGGYYDRSEREFFGFARVTARSADGSAFLTEYHNNDYTRRGLVRRAAARDPSGSILAETLVETENVPVSGYGRAAVRFPATTAVERRTIDPQSGEEAVSRVEYGYDFDTGNIRTVRDLGDPARASDDVFISISYARLGDRFRRHPECVETADSAGRLLTRTRGSYGGRGDLAALDEYYTADLYARRSIAWDEWGNPAALTDPRGSRLRWDYDGETHGFAVAVIKDNAAGDAEVYESRAQWDCSLGRPLWREDANGGRVAWTYDSFGRPVAVSSPYDAAAGLPAVRYAYDTTAYPWTALTHNKLLHDPEDSLTLRTAVCVDGLGRPLQTATEGELRAGDGTRRFGWNLSGALGYDALGRLVAEGQPRFYEGPGLPGPCDLFLPTLREYDSLGRPVLTTLPDGATIRVRYSVIQGLLAETTTDPLGKIRETRSDVRGNTLTLTRKDENGTALAAVDYEYDALGRMLKAADARGEALSAAYDLAGRRLSLTSPAAGTIRYEYDEAGNLIKRTDSRLRARGECLRYAYDGHNRLVRIDYPGGDATVYEYGGNDADSRARNAADRLVSLSDRSGAASYSYGELGEIRTLSRSLNRLTPLAAAESATLAYEWDYLGRLQKIVYPDGEELVYGYDSGGRVSSVSGRYRGLSTDYVRDIAYDEFGQRIRIEYGNGVRTEYAYDARRRWLDEIETRSGRDGLFQDIRYDFDAAGNVLGFDNVSAAHETRQRYCYDSLYRLTSARGATEYRPHGVPEYTGAYEQTFAFDAAGNLARKASARTSSPCSTLGDDLDYDLAYTYASGGDRPPETIGEARYSYDANGNVIEIREGGLGFPEPPGGEIQLEGEIRHTDYGFGLVRNPTEAGTARTREYVWDEESRLTKYVEGDLTVRYRYGSDNLRTVKRCADSETLYFDSLWQTSFDAGGSRQSKHVYVGRTRVATRLGIPGNVDTAYPRENTYYYHADHLGSAQVVTDCRGEEYQRIEYTPYGELWVEQERDSLDKIPFRFVGKERDEESGLYYFGARYLDAKTTEWLSPDPALGAYLPSDGAGRALPGLGGVYNPVNLHPYHYAGYNPVKYTDPEGMAYTIDTIGELTYRNPSHSCHSSRGALDAWIQIDRPAGHTLGHFKSTLGLNLRNSTGEISVLFQNKVQSYADRRQGTYNGVDYTMEAGEYSGRIEMNRSKINPVVNYDNAIIIMKSNGEPYGSGDFLIHPNQTRFGDPWKNIGKSDGCQVMLGGSCRFSEFLSALSSVGKTDGGSIGITIQDPAERYTNHIGREVSSWWDQGAL